MNFISLTFVFLFPIVLILYWKLPWKYRELFLLAVSYFFYIKESSWAGGLLLLTTVTTYLAGLAIEKGRHKKGWLIFTVAVCIGLLIGLKYSVPPVGISFYTFQTMAYVIDVYRGEIAAEKNPRSYALFISFFRSWSPVLSNELKICFLSLEKNISFRMRILMQDLD